MRSSSRPETDGVGVGHRWFATGDVDGVSGGAEGGDELAEGGVEVVGHGAEEVEAVVDAGVGEEDAGAPSAGDDDDVLALGSWEDGDAAGELEHVSEGAGADDAALLEDVLVDLVIAGQRAGVGAGGERTGAGAAGFQHDDGLLLGDAGGDLGEAAAVFQVLAVLGDDVGRVVLLEERRAGRPLSMSLLLPRPTMAETPILALRLKPMMAMPMPPDWLLRAAWPLTS